jgi:hypothetical protein
MVRALLFPLAFLLGCTGENGLYVPDGGPTEDLTPVVQEDRLPMPAPDLTGLPDLTPPSALPDLEKDDMANPPCANGKPLVGAQEWMRGDIVLCESPLLPTPVDAAAMCGTGWHLCSSVEFTLRNDAFASGVQFMATLKEQGCVATNAIGPGHDASSDYVRQDAPGTCQGPKDNGKFGRQDSNGYYGGSAFPHMGAICCQ